MDDGGIDMSLFENKSHNLTVEKSIFREKVGLLLLLF